jgi:hypothetical protein
MEKERLKFSPQTWAMIASVIIAAIAGLWSFSRSSVSRKDVREMIREYSPPKADIVRVGEGLKAISNQVRDLKSSQDRRFDRIDHRLDRLERKK